LRVREEPTVIDLHTHSRFSDGSATPTEVIDLAVEAGCTAIALTDHDGLAGLTEAENRAKVTGLDFVRGCEVSASFQPGSLHLLCYFVPAEGALPRKLAELRSERGRRNEKLLDLLAGLGFGITREEVEIEAGSDVIGRPHFAAVLVHHGVVASVEEAFQRYLAKGAPAYVEREHVEPAQILELAKQSGALTSIAHPMTLGLEPAELGRLLENFSRSGVDAMECYYSSYDVDLQKELVAMARRHGLVPTGGSDFHGTFKPGLYVGTGRGDLCVPDEVLDELRSRLPS
jgi:3',5'-nucleoside bisphosphate phosphatase